MACLSRMPQTATWLSLLHPKYDWLIEVTFEILNGKRYGCEFFSPNKMVFHAYSNQFQYWHILRIKRIHTLDRLWFHPFCHPFICAPVADPCTQKSKTPESHHREMREVGENIETRYWFDYWFD